MTGAVMDRRLTPRTERVAHSSLRGLVDSPAFTDGSEARIATPLADLLTAPNGARDRQLLLGDEVLVIDEDGAKAFVQSRKDGHCGWVDRADLGGTALATHWLSAPASHLYPEPRVQARALYPLYFGSRLTIVGTQGAWAETTLGFVPLGHLSPLGVWATDPVTVAESLLGTPYLWGGNSRAGVDCSGLVQLALHACGQSCPSDSDLQMSVGTAIPEAEPLQRGDLIFWKGHVAMVADDTRLIHANGHSMSVAYEGTVECIARIAAQTKSDVIARRRP